MLVRDRQWRSDLLSALRNLTVEYGKDSYWDAARTISSGPSEIYEIDYLYKGSGKIVIADREYPVKPYDLFIMNPGESYSLHTSSNKPLEGCTFNFSLSVAGKPPLFPNYIGNLARLLHNQQWELENLLRKACIEMNRGSKTSPLLASCFMMVFFALLLRYLQDVEHLLSPDAPLAHVERVIEYIRRHYDRHITLNDLARVAQLDPEYLCHKFSIEVGMSPIALLTKERMEAAKQLLVNTRLSVSEVGMRVGYPDAYHFSRRFKEVVGKPPRQYRAELEPAFPQETELILSPDDMPAAIREHEVF